MTEVAANTASVRADAPGLRVWHVGAGLVVFFVAINLAGIIGFHGQEPDDYLRLVQVRDWLGGQAWYDSTQYRFAPPEGANIHWVRLVDLPIAFFMLLFSLFLEGRAMETAALTTVPMLQLIVAIAILRALMVRLGANRTEMLSAIAIIPLMPMLITNFMPMRIDHHGWQAIAALTMVWMFLRGDYRSAAIGGFVAALLLWISLEGMPLAAIIGGVYALRYIANGTRGHEGYLLGLGLAGPALFFALRPLGALDEAWCDMMSWPHFLAFGGALIVALAGRALPETSTPKARLLTLLPIPLVAAPAMLLPLGECAVSPMATLDPVLRENWFDMLLESAPVWRQIPSVAAMLFAMLVLLGLGYRVARRRFADAKTLLDWQALALITLLAVLIALVMARAAITAQLLLLPFCGVLIAHLLPKARALDNTVLRALATVAVFLVATPALASMVAKQFDGDAAYTLAEHPQLGEDGVCDIDRLNALPTSHLFNALDKGAEIIARTPHSAVIGGYHRNQEKMLEIFTAFGGPLDEAEGIVRANRARYVVACTASADLGAYANMGEDTLADRIFAREEPDWLQPADGFETGALRVYEVR